MEILQAGHTAARAWRGLGAGLLFISGPEKIVRGVCVGAVAEKLQGHRPGCIAKAVQYKNQCEISGLPWPFDVADGSNKSEQRCFT